MLLMLFDTAIAVSAVAVAASAIDDVTSYCC